MRAAPHKGKRAIELSLHVAKVNDGIGAGSLTAGLQLAACVRSIEDHGFLLSIGIQVGLLRTVYIFLAVWISEQSHAIVLIAYTSLVEHACPAYRPQRDVDFLISCVEPT